MHTESVTESLALSARSEARNLTRGTHSPIHAAGLLLLLADLLIDQEQQLDNLRMLAGKAIRSAPELDDEPAPKKAKPASASKHRHEFGADGVCGCGEKKGKRGRPAKVAPAVPAVALAGDAAADKYADGNNGGSARR
jgi:hypothetical protein